MGFFNKLKEGLKKTKDNIGKKIFTAFSGRALDEEFFEELEEAMLTADMGVAATEEIIDQFKQELYEDKISDHDEAKKLLKRIMVDSISYEIPDYDYPLLILLAGVNGVGKTTAIGKLANHFKSQGKSVIVAAADTFRAAASDQLEIWAERAGVRIVKHQEGSDPASVVFDALASAKAKGDDVILVDTAGRLHNKKNLMDELKKIHRVIMRELPDADYRSYIVVDATTGQNALQQVEIFAEAIDIDGIILTKLDGTAKGGVVMAISAEQEIPVVFVGVGEKIDDLLPFDPSEFVDAIL